MVNLVLMMWGALVSASLATTPISNEDQCDDGSSAWDENGNPNWSCTRDGCSPSADSCWAERTEHCVDDQGRDRCSLAEEHCHSKLACFGMWLSCNGTYKCNNDDGVGCTDGTCESTTSDGGDGPEDLTRP